MPRIPIAFLLFATLAAPASAHEPRVVGGDTAAIDSVPFAASLVRAGAPARESHFCSGSVIGAQYVLTAAHCLPQADAADIEVVTSRSRLSDETAGQRTPVAAIFKHPDWDGTNGDVAVLRLAGPVTAPPVALSRGGSHERPGTAATSAGWGVTTTNGPVSNDLRSVELPLATTSACRQDFGDAFDARTMICAGGEGRAPCSGDSGGPLLAGGVQIGVVSFGSHPCGSPGVPDVFMRMSAYASWVADVTGVAAPPGAAPVAPPARRAQVRIGRISCGPVRCRIEVRARGDLAQVSVSVRDRSALARPVARDRWVARMTIPDGVSTIIARPLDITGVPVGRAARARIELS